MLIWAGTDVRSAMMNRLIDTTVVAILLMLVTLGTVYPHIPKAKGWQLLDEFLEVKSVTGVGKMFICVDEFPPLIAFEFPRAVKVSSCGKCEIAVKGVVISATYGATGCGNSVSIDSRHSLKIIRHMETGRVMKVHLEGHYLMFETQCLDMIRVALMKRM